MIDRYLVRYFLAVVDQGTFSRAARETNVAQPTLSVGIAKLESLLGETLFERSTRRISLTSAGARFLPHARRIESEFNQAAVSVRSEGTPEVFRLGILSTIPARLVGQAFGEVLSAHPEMRVEIVEGSEKELTNALARRRVDTALTIVGRGGERNVEERLYTEPYHVAMMADHPCASQSAVTVEDLAGSIMMVRRHCEALSETSRFFTEQGVRPHSARPMMSVCWPWWHPGWGLPSCRPVTTRLVLRCGPWKASRSNAVSDSFSGMKRERNPCRSRSRRAFGHWSIFLPSAPEHRSRCLLIDDQPYAGGRCDLQNSTRLLDIAFCNAIGHNNKLISLLA